MATLNVITRQEFAYQAMSGLRNWSTHEEMYNALVEVWESLAEEHNETVACALMKRLFEDYIVNNDIRSKAKAEGCDPFEYLYLSESEVQNLVGVPGR